MLLQQVSHGAVQFMVYEELRKFVGDFKSKEKGKTPKTDVKLLVSLYNQYLPRRSGLITVMMCWCPFALVCV